MNRYTISTRAFTLVFAPALAFAAVFVVAPSTGPIVRSEFRLISSTARDSFEWRHGVASSEPHPLPDETKLSAAYHARLTKAVRIAENVADENRERLRRLTALAEDFPDH